MSGYSSIMLIIWMIGDLLHAYLPRCVYALGVPRIGNVHDTTDPYMVNNWLVT